MIGQWSLWIIALGLMLASSGIDGTYLARWMPDGWQWLGYVLNTMSDIASIVLTYWYGRLQQIGTRRKEDERKFELSRFLLAAEGVTFFYSWFFSWRQLRLIMFGVEVSPLLEGMQFQSLDMARVEVELISAISAGFIPILLAFVGFTQALLAGKATVEGRTESATAQTEAVQSRTKPARAAKLLNASRTDWREICTNPNGCGAELARICAGSCENDAETVNTVLVSCGFARKPQSTARDWAKAARDWAKVAKQESEAL